jgi:acyl-CoA synthetase (AMP-forming)/AMP-acid ligase II
MDVKLSEGDEEECFKTGDIAKWQHYNSFIMGRVSVDTIKSGRYKTSAFDIERECLGPTICRRGHVCRY